MAYLTLDKFVGFYRRTSPAPPDHADQASRNMAHAVCVCYL